MQKVMDSNKIENGIVLPDNITNGDVIEKIFPNGCISEGRTKIYYSFYPNGKMEFTKDWWNMPYNHWTTHD